MMFFFHQKGFHYIAVHKLLTKIRWVAASAAVPVARLDRSRWATSSCRCVQHSKALSVSPNSSIYYLKDRVFVDVHLLEVALQSAHWTSTSCAEGVIEELSSLTIWWPDKDGSMKSIPAKRHKSGKGKLNVGGLHPLLKVKLSACISFRATCLAQCCLQHAGPGAGVWKVLHI